MFCKENHLHFLAYFSLLAKMSDQTPASFNARKLRIKQYILDLNSRIGTLLDEVNSESVKKSQKEDINQELKD